MAWEWVAPTATGALGGVGVVFTWLTGHQGRKHAERIMKETHLHDRRIASEQQRQARIGEAYVEILQYLATAIWAATERPRRPNEGEEEWAGRLERTNPPSIPDNPEIARVTALVRAYGSKPVRQIFDGLHFGIDRLYGRSISVDRRNGLIATLTENYRALGGVIRAELNDMPLDLSEPVFRRASEAEESREE